MWNSCLIAVLLMCGSAWADEPDQTPSEEFDKNYFHLFDPTFPKLMREMATDSHGATETPYTVDAGHFQVEVTLVRYAHNDDFLDGHHGVSESWEISPLLLKAGLFNHIDAELLIEPYTIVHEEVGPDSVTRRGFGDLTVRLKANALGNDGGRVAVAVMPYFTLPTRDNDLGETRIAGGFILPLSVRIKEGLYLDLTEKVGNVWNKERNRYDSEFSQSISLGRDFGRDFFAYVEFFSIVGQRDVPWIGSIDTGLIYSLSENVQFSAGINIGVTRAADDWSPFIGVAYRY